MKLITLDFEGTLVNFQWNLEKAREEVLNALVEKGISREIFRTANYAAIYNMVREKSKAWGFDSNHLISLIDQIYDFYDMDAASRWKPVEGLYDVLEQLKVYKIALVTNVGKKGLTKALAQHGLENSFDLIITRNDTHFLKPAGDALLQAIDRAGAIKENTIHIGDSLADLFAARAAGIKCGIVLGGEHEPGILLREKPNIVMEQLTELPSALKKINF
ncbi:MAG TPA: HAD family hydrolase [Firmicutes bacterium]|nr:HAD family hydrolase [Bacillota bacterium]